jgi:SAM-dependent methyltransferase
MTTDCIACGTLRHPMMAMERWGYSVHRCPSCGLGSTRRPEHFDPASIYTADYFQGRRKDGYADYCGSENVLRREFRKSLKVLFSAGCTGGRLFEIGAAYGFFLDEARSAFEVSGVEPCEDAAKACRSRGLEVHSGTIEEGQLQSHGPLDALVMLDVIEHLQAPFSVLQMVHRNMKTGGHLLLTTGDWDSVLSRVMGSRWRLMTPPQHLFFFSAKTLRILLFRAGFDVIRLDRPTKTVPLELLLYQLWRIAGLRPRAVPWLRDMCVPINLFDAVRVLAIKSSRI